MDEIKFKIAAAYSKQIMLYFVDFFGAILPIFDKRNIYRIPLKAYKDFRIDDKRRFSKDLYRLKREGFIKNYLDGKEKFIELTDKGRKLLKKHITEQMEIEAPKNWDGKWRIVVFDIPDDKKEIRDTIRYKLKNIGFVELQESVYVYPFDCADEIQLLKQMYVVEPYVQYIEADRIETEKDLLKIFYDLGVLNGKMLGK